MISDGTGGVPLRRLALVATACAALTLGACELTMDMGISPGGLAQVEVEIALDRELIESPGPTCEQVMDGTIGHWLPTATLVIDEVQDGASLRCVASGEVSLVEAGWDGQSGRPTWSANTEDGYYSLTLPFSDGLGEEGLSAETLAAAGLSGEVSMDITMPAPVRRTSAGTIEGNTVHVSGVEALANDLVVVASTKDSAARWWWLGGGSVAGIAVAWLLWRSSRKRRDSS